MMALNEHSIRIPQDISITGMDDIDYARMMNPSLTTVRNDPIRPAKTMISRMLSLLEGKQMEMTGQASSCDQIIVRNSTRSLRD